MDDLTVKIHNKKIKLEMALSELNDEISASFNFLQRLRNHSAEIVSDLNSVTSPAIYFKGFADVNSFILKNLSFLTEINCKFEMLRISENPDMNSHSVTESTVTSKTGVPDNSHSQLGSCKSLANSQNKDDKNEQAKESEKVNCEVESPKANSSNNSQNKNADFKNNLHRNPDTLDDCSVNFSLNVETGDPEMRTTKGNKNISEASNMEASNSEMPPQITCIGQIDKERLNAVNKPGAASIDSANTSTCTEKRRTDLTTADIPVAEVIPTQISAFNYNSGILAGIRSLQETSFANLRFPWEGTFEENMNEGEIKPIRISRNVGDEYEISIEEIHSPSEFYVYLKDPRSNLFIGLLQNLVVVCGARRKVWDKRNGNIKAWLSERLGSYVLYYSRYDEVWCRAEVLNWNLHHRDDYIKIFLVDYGEYKCVSIDDIDAMPRYFKNYPACAVRCHLYGISPSDIDMDIDTFSWGKESTERMKCVTETSKNLRIRIAPEDDFIPESSLPVTLWVVDQNNACVNELLVRSKFAVYCFDVDPEDEPEDEPEEEPEEEPEDEPEEEPEDEPGEEPGDEPEDEPEDEIQAEGEILEHWNPMKEDFEAYENSYDLNIDDPATYIYGYVGKDYERICKHFAKTGHCFKGQACKKEHKKFDPLGFTTDQEEIYKNAFNSLYVPPQNSVVRVQVTCLLALNTFCCILDNGNVELEEENLQTLLEFMNKPENIQQMKKLLIPPSTGQIVIAQYIQDKFWYRAKILESQPENDLYTIVFVDYGNKETVSLSEIRAIEERYLHLPFQAMLCHIFGIECNPEVAPKDAVNYLNKIISKGQISIEIVSKLPGETTNLLVHLFDESGKNIAADLMAKNFAVVKEEIIISSESESIPG